MSQTANILISTGSHSTHRRRNPEELPSRCCCILTRNPGPGVNLSVVTESDRGVHFVIRSGLKEDHVVFSAGRDGFSDKDIQTDGNCAVVRYADGKVVSSSVAGGKKLAYPEVIDSGNR